MVRGFKPLLFCQHLINDRGQFSGSGRYGRSPSFFIGYPYKEPLQWVVFRITDRIGSRPWPACKMFRCREFIPKCPLENLFRT